jgi:hypothetical protein
VKRIITMWCPKCELWAKDMDKAGFHTCGAEVMPGDASSVDLYYEGPQPDTTK